MDFQATEQIKDVLKGRCTLYVVVSLKQTEAFSTVPVVVKNLQSCLECPQLKQLHLQESKNLHITFTRFLCASGNGGLRLKFRKLKNVFASKTIKYHDNLTGGCQDIVL